MPKRVLVIMLVTLLAPSVALAQKVTRDWDKAFDFSKVRTFAVKMGTSWGNQLSEKRVMNDISEALTERGWMPAPESSADAIVVLHGATQTKRTLNTFYDSWGPGWGWSGGSGMSTTTTSEYLVGSLVVDIFDARTKQLAFRGTATDEISRDPAKNVKKSEKAAQKLFKDFPPQPKKT